MKTFPLKQSVKSGESRVVGRSERETKEGYEFVSLTKNNKKKKKVYTMSNFDVQETPLRTMSAPLLSL